MKMEGVGNLNQFYPSTADIADLGTTSLRWRHFYQVDNGTHFLGTGQDASILYDGTNLIIDPRVVGAGAVVIGAGAAGVDYRLMFDGETNDGTLDWMEDEDYFRFNDDINLGDGEFAIFDKASGNGIKVDATTPTFGFADILGDQFSKNTGATKPTLATYN